MPRETFFMYGPYVNFGNIKQVDWVNEIQVRPENKRNVTSLSSEDKHVPLFHSHFLVNVI